jgi:hypothetical protein
MNDKLVEEWKEFREIEKDVIEEIRFVFNPLFKKKKIENLEEFMKKNVYADRLWGIN